MIVVSHVAGGSVDGVAGTVESRNPAQLDDVVAQVSLASADQLVEAFRAAKQAQPGWAATPAPVRGRVVAQIGRLVEANAEALAQLIVREVGKPLAEARGEVQEIIDTCDFFLGEGRRLYGQTVPSEMRDKQLFTFRVPVGVAGIITAGNFPVAVPSWSGSPPSTPPRSATHLPSCSSPAACPPACSTPCTPTARRPSRG